MAKRKKRRVAMATKRRKRSISRKEKLRRSRISKALKAYHRKQRRQREPFLRAIVEGPPRQSLGDFILGAIRDLELQQKEKKFQLPEGRQIAGFEMKDRAPDLPRRFGHNETARIEFGDFFIEGDQAEDRSHYREFDTGTNDEEFWHNYYAAVREELDDYLVYLDDAGYDDATSQEVSIFVASVA